MKKSHLVVLGGGALLLAFAVGVNLYKSRQEAQILALTQAPPDAKPGAPAAAPAKLGAPAAAPAKPGTSAAAPAKPGSPRLSPLPRSSSPRSASR